MKETLMNISANLSIDDIKQLLWDRYVLEREVIRLRALVSIQSAAPAAKPEPEGVTPAVPATNGVHSLTSKRGAG